MLRLSLVVILLTHSIRTAHVTEAPSVYDRIFQKLDELTPKIKDNELTQTETLFDKLNRLDSLSPDIDRVELSDENELISAMHTWLNPEQVGEVYKVIEGLKTEGQDSEQEYGENYWNDEDSEQGEEDYVMDGNDDWDDLTSDSSSTAKPFILGIPEGVTPSAITKLGASDVLSAAASILATKARPRILEGDMTKSERQQLGSAVLRNTRVLIREGACLVPQPRWLTVKQLAPAADTAYTPPCVQLHRCAHDSGCCTNESHVCAPIEGRNVIFPFYLHKAGGIMNVVKMQFYNHTKCGCVSRERLESTIAIRRSMGIRIGSPNFSDIQEEEPPQTHRVMDRQNDWRVPTEGPLPEKEDEDTTAPPQLRRCTCPRLFLANMTSNSPCACVCGWPDISKRRDCLYLAKGKEHFGIPDRVCIKRGDCTAPTCEYGAYDRVKGKCPLRRYRRYHMKGRFNFN